VAQLARIGILLAVLLQGGALPLDPSTRVTRTLKGGEAHSYEVPLAADQFIWVIVDQRGIDVGVTAVDPAGQTIAFSDNPNGVFGPESLAIIANSPGTYRIDIAPRTATAAQASYELRVEASRPATATDREHVAALRAFADAQRLRAQNTADSRLQAIAQYEHALAFFRASGDRFNEVLTAYRIALVRANSSDFRSALDSLLAVLPIASTLGEPNMTASVLNLAGGAFDALGDLSNALKFYGDALTQFRALGNVNGQAAALNNIGKIAYDTADWDTSLNHFTLALHLFEAEQDRTRQAVALRNIGQVHSQLGDLDKALEYYQRALPLRRATGEKAGEAEVLTTIGAVYVQLGQRQNALDAYAQALELRRAVGDPRGLAQTLAGLGDAHAAFGDLPVAAANFDAALPLLRAGGDRRELALLLTSIGTVRTRLHQPSDAIAVYRESLDLLQALGDKQSESRALRGMAQAQLDAGNLAGARESIAQSVSQLESVRAGVVTQDMRASYLAAQQDAYLLYMDIEMRGQNPAAALDASERARARSLLELLSEARVDIRRGVDVTLLAREKRLAQSMDAKAQRMMQLPAGTAGETRSIGFKKDIAELGTELEQVRAEIRRTSPAFAAIAQPQPLNARAIQQLLDEETVLIEYALGRERSYAWTVTTATVHGYALPPQADIEQAARAAYTLVTARSTAVTGESPRAKQDRIAEADRQTPAAVQALSRLVLAPLQADLRHKRIVVVADGALQYVPFGMLSLDVSDAAPRPLIADAEVVSAPSASAVAVQRRAVAERSAPTKGIAIIADPVFSSRDARVVAARAQPISEAAPADSAATRILAHLAASSGDAGGLTIPRLPFTADEARQIESVAGAMSHLTALGFRASRSTTLDPDLANYRYVHFATHGYLDAERPDLSALVLSLVDARGNPQDGFLRAHDVYNLSLRADLVVLSACETGLGKEIKGEGLVGLTRGFMYAGAARVAVSLWSVSDRATADLMRTFYQAMLAGGQRPAAALRAAQLDMIKRKAWSAPYYWAAFVLQGDWQ
jgi:CHAT domain-containing protein/tetratricopeptide (TPR) repeat protein